MTAQPLKTDILAEDATLVVESPCPLEELAGKTVLVTGATGLIGSTVVRVLLTANELKELGIHVVALVRKREKAEHVFGGLVDAEGLELLVGDVTQPLSYEGTVDYIVHGASPTSSRFFVSRPVETIATAIDGTRNVLEFAREKHVSGMVYLSSLEVYGTPSQDGPISERDYGYIDPLSVRSSYSEGKRLCECLCCSYAAEFGVPVKIARLSQTFGAGVAYDDPRVFAEFARCAVEKKNIVLHTAGNTLRTYCYTRDAASALVYVLLKGEPGTAYNVTNPDTGVTIREMAQTVCETFPESGISVEFDTPDDLASFGYNPEMRIRLDPTRLEELGWKPTVGLAEMFTRMVAGFGR